MNYCNKFIVNENTYLPLLWAGLKVEVGNEYLRIVTLSPTASSDGTFHWLSKDSYAWTDMLTILELCLEAYGVIYVSDTSRVQGIPIRP